MPAVEAPLDNANPAEPEAEAIHVEVHGDDAAAGDADHPLATLTEALRRAEGGESVLLGPGDYPPAVADRPFPAQVVVRGPENGEARVAGLEVLGSARLLISEVSFTGGVMIREKIKNGGNRGASEIGFVGVRFTASGSCLRARNAASNVSVRLSVFEGCRVGVGAPAGGTIPQSSGLSISGSRFAGITGDAIQIGQWDNVRITDNVIDDIRDPANIYHNDGIQFTGNVQHAYIARNRISNSRTQLIFLQDAVGPIDDVTVENNDLWRAGAVAMQVRGVTRARIVHNSIWGGKDGGLWLAADAPTATRTPTVATDTLLANNLAQDIRIYGGAKAAQVEGNVTLCGRFSPAQEAAVGSTCVTDPGFVDIAAGDLRLRASAAPRSLGSAGHTLLTDLEGLTRTLPLVPGAHR